MADSSILGMTFALKLTERHGKIQYYLTKYCIQPREGLDPTVCRVSPS
jgi:hypothetical protein